MSDKPLMTDVRQAFDAVRENATKGSPFQGAAGAAIDGAALVMAQKARGRLSEVKDLALTWDQWTRLIAILQQEFAIAIRHAAFDPPEFPGAVKHGSRQFATAQACVRAGCGGYLRWRGDPLSSWECDRCLCDENGNPPVSQQVDGAAGVTAKYAFLRSCVFNLSDNAQSTAPGGMLTICVATCDYPGCHGHVRRVPNVSKMHCDRCYREHVVVVRQG